VSITGLDQADDSGMFLDGNILTYSCVREGTKFIDGTILKEIKCIKGGKWTEETMDCA
jgi:hypothetical protein